MILTLRCTASSTVLPTHASTPGVRGGKRRHMKVVYEEEAIFSNRRGEEEERRSLRRREANNQPLFIYTRRGEYARRGGEGEVVIGSD